MALMDQVYRRQRHFYDLTRRYYLVGRDRLIRGLALKPGETAIEVGCGTARNLIAIATRYPGVRLFGLDASALMLETAANAVVCARFSERVELAQSYAELLSPETFRGARKFDRVIFSYSLSMIPDWRRALAAAEHALAPAGQLHIVDFGDFSGFPRVLGSALRLWLRQFHVQPRGEILRALESSPRNAGDTLWIAPGRYAFLSSAATLSGQLTNVAGPPQAAGNS
jgi:S-adenosylmethionine-diacylgycerolhomoserine-N-methlytransferase